MEFRWAAEGKTEKLRQWLREHPERVNVPAQGSNMTLLYTCISNANRTDLASLQAGHSCYLSTIQMLCEEYKADVLAPNGGSCNTALHLAASIGAAGVVRYLVEVLHTPVDSTNVFGERPLQIAQRNGHTKCASILTAAAAAAAAAKSPSAQDQPLAGRDATPSQPASPCTPPLSASAGGLAGEYGGLFRGVTVSDRDDKGDDEGMMMRSDARVVTAVRATNEWNHHRLLDGIGGGPPSLPTQVTPLCGNGSRSAVFSMDGSSGFAVAGTAHSSPPHLHSKGLSRGAARCTKTTPARFAALAESDSAACLPLPVPLQPRKEYDISSSHIFANPDLQGFRLVYGDGFKFVQCSDHYEIRGILPYTYRGTVYYTPVIISVYAPLSPTDSLDSTAGGGYAARGNDAADAASDEAVLSYPPSGTLRVGASEAATLPILNKAATKVDVHCRYRVCLNLQSLNNFTISRKAEYLDPISGAIIPAPGDDKYQSLTAYIRNVVVRNFEAVPPLIVPTSSYAFPLLPNLSWLGSSGDADVYRHHHSHNAPAFMKNALPNRTAAHIRCATILRDLSRFGDGLARYDPEKHCIAAYIPIFSEHKVSVLAMPQERPYVTTAGQGSTTDAGKSTLREDSATFSGGKAEVTQQVAVEAVVELQVRVFIQFSPTCSSRSNAASAEAGVGSESNVYTYPPRIYLVDATTRPLGHLVDGSTPTNTAVPGSPSSSSTPSTSSTAAAAAAAGTTLTAQCFAGIIKNRETGEVWPELLHLSQESWSATGSLYNILVELQRALKGVLESFAMNYTGRSFSSSPPRGRLHFSGSDSRPAGAPPRAPVMSSSLDKFFGPTPISTQSLTTGLGSEGSCSIRRSSAGYCLYCMQSLRSSSRALLLMPCGHNGLCGLCVQRLQSHCREEVFACPVCRGGVRYVMEVVPSEGGKKA